MPLLDSQVDAAEAFIDSEVLYRRVSPDEVLSTGEIDASRFSIKQYAKDVKGAPSVIRSFFSVPEDVLHPDCAGGKSHAGYLIYRISVGELPQEFRSEDDKLFSTFPVHLPEANCGAHSVIATCKAGDSARQYAKPSRTAINDLRAKLAIKFTLQPSRDEIARLAYHYWELQGRPDDRGHEHWIAAERKLIALRVAGHLHPEYAIPSK